MWSGRGSRKSRMGSVGVGGQCGSGGDSVRSVRAACGSFSLSLARIGELLFALRQLDAQAFRDRQAPQSKEEECSDNSQDSDGSGSDGDIGVDVKHLSVAPPGWGAPLLKGGSPLHTVALE